VSEKQRPGRYLLTKIWMTASLTYSFSIITPDRRHYRKDGFLDFQEALAARTKLGEELEALGEGRWKEPKLTGSYQYVRRGPRSSPSSYLTDAIFNADSRLGLRPDMLPDLPGSRVTRR
jgi:hypothetical protein